MFHTIYTTHILYLICLNTRIGVQHLIQCSLYTSWLNYRWTEKMLHASSGLTARGKIPALLRKYLQVPSILNIMNKQTSQRSLEVIERNGFPFCRWENWDAERGWVTFFKGKERNRDRQAGTADRISDPWAILPDLFLQGCCSQWYLPPLLKVGVEVLVNVHVNIS